MKYSYQEMINDLFNANVYTADIDSEILDGFENHTSKNDICPSYVIYQSGDHEYVLFVDAIAPCNREDPGSDRFYLIKRDLDGDSPDTVLSCENLIEIMPVLIWAKYMNI